MEDSCSTSGGSSSFPSRRRRRRRRKVPPKQGETAAEVIGGGEGEKKRKYTGVRLRSRGRWVAEVREPNKRTRTWLGSYASPVAAARAYDTAVYCLYGSTARLNFPGDISPGTARERDPASMRQKAMEVGTSVDAALLETPPAPPPIREPEKPDLNLRSSDDDDDKDD